MIDLLVNKLFWWTPLRNSIIKEVHMYDYIKSILEDPESKDTGSLFYTDIDGWKSWSHDKEAGRYYFNDVPEENIMAAMSALTDMEEKNK
jgi:hypothetical protein